MYRMTNKPPPTTPSPYVVKVLKPLKPFVSEWRDTLGHATCDEWTEGVCGAVVDRYLSKVSELLVDVREKEAVTAARGKAKKKQGEMSDTEKIVHSCARRTSIWAIARHRCRSRHGTQLCTVA